MLERSQQISSPLLLPMLGSILSTGIIASILILPPSQPTLSFQELLLRSALDLTIAACIHIVTVWSIWRLIREYVEPSVGTLTIHIWAVTVWLPLITTLTAERSLWISCIVPWAIANAVTFLNLWSNLPQDDEPVAPAGRILLQPPSTLPLWRALLPYCSSRYPGTRRQAHDKISIRLPLFGCYSYCSRKTSPANRAACCFR